MPTRVEGTKTDPRYPIGHFAPPETIGPEEIASAISTIEELPKALRSATAGLSEAQLDTPYRDGGWTVRQLVHHVADSHMNAFIRVRLALTEESPLITAYDEKAWAELADSKGPIELSLGILDGVHARWVTLLRSLDDMHWSGSFGIPSADLPVSIWLRCCISGTACTTRRMRPS